MTKLNLRPSAARYFAFAVGGWAQEVLRFMEYFQKRKIHRQPKTLSSEAIIKPWPLANHSGPLSPAVVPVGFQVPVVVGQPLTAIRLPILETEAGRTRLVYSERGEERYEVDLARYTCTCRSFKAGRAHFDERDMRRACRHISGLLALKGRSGKISGFLHVVIVHRLNYGRGIWVNGDRHPMCYIQIDGEDLLLVKSDTGGVDVFAPKLSPIKAYGTFGYSPTKDRWSALGVPGHPAVITEIIHQWIRAGQAHGFVAGRALGGG